MSSHREAPEISKDPVADSTDTYLFVSPDDPTTVTMIANYIPLERPDGGPNFYEFGEDVLYEIYIDNDGDALPEITYQFRFHTAVRNPDTFLYNTGPITSLDSPNWNRPQTYSVTRLNAAGAPPATTGGLTCPPCNIGPNSTPKYSALAQAAVHTLPTGETVFAGQRRDGFYVDLGAVFDLADLRPFQQLHVNPLSSSAAPGVDSLKGVNVHTIALKVPINMLTADGSTPTDVTSAKAVLGMWTAAKRQVISLRYQDAAGTRNIGPFVQVSRLGQPLINEAVIPMSLKDDWNAQQPLNDSKYVPYYEYPEIAKLLPILYPGVFPNLAQITGPRADLDAILLTGIPSGIVPGFQNYSGSVPSDMLRLNVAVPPSAKPSALGILGGDLAGYPNGRRVQDDVFTIELRAIAGATYPLVNSSYKPDGAAALVTDALTPDASRYQSTFPYLADPISGWDVMPAAS
ncbi:MAG TPA: DUF4331 domain-containing protein [Chloroflexota bacterium]|nr:DUF4331 domain-containing protein [Chloroflexota bacterium]